MQSSLSFFIFNKNTALQKEEKMKLSQQIEGNYPKLPKFNKDDTFRQKFIKYARYLGEGFPDQVTDVIGTEFAYERLEMLLPHLKTSNIKDFVFHIGERLDEIESCGDLDKNSLIAIRAILNKCTGIRSIWDAVVFFNEKTAPLGEEMIIVLPSLSAVYDGSSYTVNKQKDARKVRIMSIGYLILASELVTKVTEKYSEQIKESSVFDWMNKNWDNSSLVSFYDEELGILLEEELDSNISFKRNVKQRKVPLVCRDKKIQDVEMNSSTLFNQLGFRKIEVDTEKYKGKEFDYQAFSKLEEAFQAIYDKLPKPSAKADLRFRRIKGETHGFYFNSLNTIVVDIDHYTSFIHEYGHYVDYKHGKERYSKQKDFSHIVSLYKDAYVKVLKGDIFEDYFVKSKKYYTSEIEVFARAFELWVSRTIVTDSPLLESSEDYENEVPYKAFQSFVGEVFLYFDNLFGSNENVQAANRAPVQLTLF